MKSAVYNCWRYVNTCKKKIKIKVFTVLNIDTQETVFQVQFMSLCTLLQSMHILLLKVHAW